MRTALFLVFLAACGEEDPPAGGPCGDQTCASGEYCSEVNGGYAPNTSYSCTTLPAECTGCDCMPSYCECTETEDGFLTCTENAP